MKTPEYLDNEFMLNKRQYQAAIRKFARIGRIDLANDARLCLMLFYK